MVSRKNRAMLRRNQKIELLQRVPLFSDCSKRELQEISLVADEVDLPKGFELTEEGASGQELVVIVEGAADVIRRGRKINSVAGGDFVGEIALVSDVPRTATVRTTEPTQAIVVSRRDFRALMQRVPSIQMKVLEALAARVPAVD
jgi:CRP/FNR family transcriptional regulator, cyclic AMP receptor protein